MQDRHHAFRVVVDGEVRGDPNVCRNTATKRVRRHVQPAVVEVEPDLPKDLGYEPLLTLDREWPRRDQDSLSRLLFHFLLDDVRKARPKSREQRRDRCCSIACFELVKKGVIRLQPELLAQRLGSLSFESYDFAE
jgi:hypothetical protein